MAELGLPPPRSFARECEQDLDAIEDRVFESAFLKPKSSPLFLQKFKAKGLTVHSRAEALARFREVTAAGFEVILQEYIPGPPTEHYFIDGFMDREHVVQARFARQRLRMHPPDFGNSTYMVSVDIGKVRPAMDALQTLLAKLDYRGIFSAEYKRDWRDGNFYLIEVNARPWWYVGFAEDCGVHVCAMAYADALGLPLPQLDPYPVGKTCVYPYIDWQEYQWHRRNHPGVPTASLLSRIGVWLTAIKPTFAWDDPNPAFVGIAAIFRQWLRTRRASARS
jgi:predicted ATP-grasp superfamily ATP-dependent carboligase